MNALSTRIKAPANRMHLKRNARHDWRWLERPSEAAKVRNFTYFTDNSKL
jgi:hypothetical protein